MADLKGFADLIVARAQPDGAIVVRVDPAVPRYSVNPYFANYAAQGLLIAYSHYKNLGQTYPAYVNTARAWFEWYMQHVDASGVISNFTGTSGQWVPDTSTTPPYDSVDAYSATFLIAASSALVNVDDATWGKNLLAFMPKPLSAMGLTLQRSGPAVDLTTQLIRPTPQKPLICYTEDNVESWAGINACSTWGVSASNLDPRAQWPKTLNAIEGKLFQAVASPFPKYQVGIAPDGGIAPSDNIAGDWSQQQAQLMAIYHLPNSARHAQLYSDMRNNFFSSVPSVIAAPSEQTELDNLDKVIWWAIAAFRYEAFSSPVLRSLADRLLAYNPTANRPLQGIGQACHFLAEYLRTSRLRDADTK